MKGKLQWSIVIRTVCDGWYILTEGIGKTELGREYSIDLEEEPKLDRNDSVIDLGVEPELDGDNGNDLKVDHKWDHKQDNKVRVIVVVEIVIGMTMI